MINLYASFVDGKIGKDFTEEKQLLIFGIILAISWAITSFGFVFYFLQFKKAETKAKMIGWPWIVGAIISSFVVLICWTLSLPFYLKAEAIFNTANAGLNTLIAIFAIGFGLLIFQFVAMFFFIAKFGVGFTESSILFIGEKIIYSKITKVIKDEEKHALYINYTQGRRTLKRQKFNLNSVMGQFILKNVELTGQKIEVGSEKEYYQTTIIANKN